MINAVALDEIRPSQASSLPPKPRTLGRGIAYQAMIEQPSLLPVEPIWDFSGLERFSRHNARNVIVKIYQKDLGYTLPSVETAELIKAQGSRRLLEIGAGSGLFSKKLAACGFDVIASDLCLAKSETGRHGWKLKHGSEFPVENLDGEAAIEAHPDRDVILAMPAPDDLWFARALLNIRPGRIAYVSLDWNPNCRQDAIMQGSAAAVAVLETNFEKIGEAPLWTICEPMSAWRRLPDPR
jgi:hypothetical protein